MPICARKILYVEKSWEDDLAPPIVKKIFVRGALGLLGAIVVLYAIDCLQIRVRLWRAGAESAYGTVTVMYGAGLKGGKYDLYTDQPDEETCARALFPQMGYAPCWYLREHTTQMIN